MRSEPLRSLSQLPSFWPSRSFREDKYYQKFSLTRYLSRFSLSLEVMRLKSEFLISATRTPELDFAIRNLDGKPLNDNSWDQDADALCAYLLRVCDVGVVVCALTCDWSYRS